MSELLQTQYNIVTKQRREQHCQQPVAQNNKWHRFSFLILPRLAQAQAGSQARTGYTRQMIDKMASLVKEYNLTQSVTFRVEAHLLKANSLAELKRLLYQLRSNSTLTNCAAGRSHRC